MFVKVTQKWGVISTIKTQKIALKYYEQYLDTGNQKFRTYTEQRIKQLREFIHFSN